MMKKYITIQILLIFIFPDIMSQNQKSTAIGIAKKISIKMSDTLHLSDAQRELIYQANLSLFQDKYKVRMTNKNPDFLQDEIQNIENKRDSLYGRILDRSQYIVYKKKKVLLLNTNP